MATSDDWDAALIAELAGYDQPMPRHTEPEPADEIGDAPWTLERHITDPAGLGVLGEAAERIVALEQRLESAERRIRALERQARP